MKLTFKLKQIAKAAFDAIGLEVRMKYRAEEARFPVELSSAERDLIQHIRQHKLSMVSSERLYTTLMACKHVTERDIEGDFVECGVWRGGNALLAAGVFKNQGSSKSTWLFDTYAGMTKPGADDVSHAGKSAGEKYILNQRDDHNEWSYASLEEVRGNFEEAALLSDKVVFVKGDVMKTLRDEDRLPQQISVLRLDTDWYESTRLELEVLYPRLSQGGILLIDDYGYWGGAKKAVDEYFAAKGGRPFLQYTDFSGRVGVKYD